MKSLHIRKNEVFARSVARSKRTSKQQLALLDRRPGEAKRERARLSA
jgi:hypothetical protein